MDAEALSLLTDGLDADFWSAIPTPDPSPVKRPLLRATTPVAPSTPSKRAANKPLSSSTSFSATNHNLSDFLQGSESWDLDADPFTPIKPGPSKQKTSESSEKYIPEPCTRCVADEITDEYVDTRWRKCVSGRVEPRNERVQVHLYDDWYNTDIQPGDVFNVIGTFTPACGLSPCTINITATVNLFILHPDLLLTATALSSAPQCRRKPLLAGLIRATSDITPALIYGSVLHEVLQRCLRENKWEEAFLDSSIAETVQEMLGDLVKLGVSEEIACREVKERARGLIPFQERYLGQEPKAKGAMTDTRGNDDSPALLAITNLLNIEEDIWSPTFGLKGKIDATVQAIIVEPPQVKKGQSNLSLMPTRRTTPLPLELKTGRTNGGMEHRAQTLLYTLLLSERYGTDVQDGLLFYSQNEEGSVVRVPRSRNEIKALICVRNDLAAWGWRRVRKRPRREEKDEGGTTVDNGQRTVREMDEEEEPEIEQFLPAPIDDERTCYRCYALDTCLLFRKTHPNHSGSGGKVGKSSIKFDPPIPDFLKDTFELMTGHLTNHQTRFFRRWEHLLALEERDIVRFKRELWTLGSQEREKKGRCWGNMVLTKDKGEFAIIAKESAVDANTESKIHRFTYTFARSREWATQGLPTNLRNGHLNTGDPVTVSIEPYLLAISKGFILTLDATHVVLGVDYPLDVPALSARTGVAPGAELIFRIDKDELYGGMARMRGNLAQLFLSDGDVKRLDLVVDLRPPVFSPPTPPFNPDAPQHAHFNASQKEAMARALAAEDYALVLGMPGTGKTTMIAALIRELVGRGKTVLLSSYTHSAVDTILRALDGQTDGAGRTFGVLRLGNPDKVHPEVRKYTMAARRKAHTVEVFERQIMSPPVVATTCLSLDHPLFFRRHFDYCIVDEASQITLPTCLGPLRFADTFVLVGDHFQLPPLVKNPEARKGGLDVSLFRRLSEAHPQAVVDLRFQYRMNADIMLLSNRLIYNDRLQCGNEEVAKSSLGLPNRTFLDTIHQQRAGQSLCKGVQQCWLASLASENCKAVFVDTDLLPASESRVGDLVQNTVEVELVRQLTETLLHCGVQESQIGVITLYRQQVKLLQETFKARPSVEILTADKSQGRDKDCIIVSLVRSNDGGSIGDLVKDWRRMNVSFTRARKKLVIFGSRRTLQREPLLASFFELMQEKNWIHPLAPGAHLAHANIFETVPMPLKRPSSEVELQTCGGEVQSTLGHRRKEKENLAEDMECRTIKKLKVGDECVKIGEMGLLKGRPILRDLIRNEAED